MAAVTRNVVTALLCAAVALPLTTHGADKAENAWRKTLAGTRLQSVRKEPTFPGMYELVMGDKIVYGDPTGRYLFFGHIYDVTTQEDITQASLDKLASKSAARRVPWDTLPLTHAVHPGKAPASAPKLAVLFSPDCGYCKRLYDDFRGRTQEDGRPVEGLQSSVDVHLLVLSPETARQPQEGKAMGRLADRIVCSVDPSAALDRVLQDIAFQKLYLADPDTALAEASNGLPARISAERCDGGKALSAVREFALANNMMSTPTLISGDGRVHRGYLAPAQLMQWLNHTEEKQVR